MLKSRKAKITKEPISNDNNNNNIGFYRELSNNRQKYEYLIANANKNDAVEDDGDVDGDENIFYNVIMAPAFGKLQYRYEGFFDEIAGPNSYINTFTQKDINQGS